MELDHLMNEKLYNCNYPKCFILDKFIHSLLKIQWLWRCPHPNPIRVIRWDHQTGLSSLGLTGVRAAGGGGHWLGPPVQLRPLLRPPAQGGGEEPDQLSVHHWHALPARPDNRQHDLRCCLRQGITFYSVSQTQTDFHRPHARSGLLSGRLRRSSGVPGGRGPILFPGGRGVLGIRLCSAQRSGGLQSGHGCLGLDQQCGDFLGGRQLSSPLIIPVISAPTLPSLRNSFGPHRLLGKLI